MQNLGEDLDLGRIEAAIDEAKGVEDRPSLIIVRTHIAPGSPNKQDTEEAHGSPLGEEEVKLTKQAYNWPSEEPFHVPEEVLAHFRQAIERGREAEAEWKERYDAWAQDNSELAADLERDPEARAPGGLGRRRAEVRARPTATSRPARHRAR